MSDKNMPEKNKSTLGKAERYRLAGTIARLVNEGSSEDVRVFCGDLLVCASYDSGRTLVLNSASREGTGLINTLQRVWNAAMRARKQASQVGR
jgi:hypothetical protein